MLIAAGVCETGITPKEVRTLFPEKETGVRQGSFTFKRKDSVRLGDDRFAAVSCGIAFRKGKRGGGRGRERKRERRREGKGERGKRERGEGLVAVVSWADARAHDISHELAGDFEVADCTTLCKQNIWAGQVCQRGIPMTVAVGREKTGIRFDCARVWSWVCGDIFKSYMMLLMIVTTDGERSNGDNRWRKW